MFTIAAAADGGGPAQDVPNLIEFPNAFQDLPGSTAVRRLVVSAGWNTSTVCPPNVSAILDGRANWSGV